MQAPLRVHSELATFLAEHRDNHKHLRDVHTCRLHEYSSTRETQSGLCTRERKGQYIKLANHPHTHIRKQQHRALTQPSQQTIPASCRNPASRQSKCSAQARASKLAGAERAKTHSRSTRNTPRNLAASRGEAEERQR